MVSNDPYLTIGALRPVERGGLGRLSRYVDGRLNGPLVVALVLAALLAAGYCTYTDTDMISTYVATAVQF